MNFLSSGTGVLTIGTLAGVAAARVPPAVVYWAIPTIMLAITAIILAALARRPMDHFPRASVPNMIPVAHDDRGEPVVKATLAAHWNLLTQAMRKPLADKAFNLGWANFLMIAAVVLLVLPLGATLYHAPTAPTPAPPSIPLAIP